MYLVSTTLKPIELNQLQTMLTKTTYYAETTLSPLKINEQEIAELINSRIKVSKVLGIFCEFKHSNKLIVPHEEVGWIIFQESDSAIELGFLYVYAKWRGVGVGKAALRQFSTEFSTKRIFSPVFSHNKISRKLHADLGFTALQTIFYKPQL